MPSSKTCALLLIGNELLSGRTQDKNLQTLSNSLNSVGLELSFAAVVPDIAPVITTHLNAMRQQYDYVFTSGGIGATHDDITTQTVADAFGARIVEHADALAALVAYYPADQLNATRCKMALMPEGVKLIINPVSAAPGFQLGNVFVLAGVPIIFKAMLEDVLPRLEAGTPIYQHTITTLLREGDVAAPLADIQERFLAVQIGSYPHFSKENPHTSLVLRSRDEPLLGQALLAVQKILEEKL